MAKAVRSIGFILIGIFICGNISKLLITGYNSYNYQMSAGFFDEPKDSLDAVYIGASPTFTSWVAPVAYEKYGITMRVFANDNQPFVAAQDMLKIARKSQPDAVYLIAINGLYSSDNISVEYMHWTTDYLPCSLDRINLISNMGGYFHYSPGEQLELYYPFIRYHSTWNVLNRLSFYPENDNLKGALNNMRFFNETVDISSSYCETEGKAPLPDFTQNALLGLLDYCRTEKVKVAFVLSAQYRDEQTLQWYNTMIEEIEAQGFPVINEIADFEEIGLDDTKDFYNIGHTNIHGALKITDYLSQYLLAHYDFPEKAGGYESWDEAYEKFSEIVRPYLTEDELLQLG